MWSGLLAGAAIAAFAWTEVAALPSPQASNSDGGGNSTNYIVAVGMADHKFTPDVIIAKPGDTVTFQFYPLNHSVVRMDPQYPCKPWEKIHKDGGFWSGFHAMDAFLDPPPTYNITINDTKPLWFYCSAPGSCINYQMVMGINPDNSTSPIAKVKSLAGEATFSLSPGEPWPSEGGTPPNPDGNTSTGSSNSTSQDSDGGTKLSSGAIAGIAIGGVIALALIGLLFFFVGRKKGTGEAKTGAQTASANIQESALMNSQIPGSEHPPLYQDPRYSVVPAIAPVDYKPPGLAETGVPAMSEHPNRLSELGATNYAEPVEIYTAGPDETPAHRNN